MTIKVTASTEASVSKIETPRPRENPRSKSSGCHFVIMGSPRKDIVQEQWSYFKPAESHAVSSGRRCGLFIDLVCTYSNVQTSRSTYLGCSCVIEALASPNFPSRNQQKSFRSGARMFGSGLCVTNGSRLLYLQAAEGFSVAQFFPALIQLEANCSC